MQYRYGVTTIGGIIGLVLLGIAVASVSPGAGEYLSTWGSTSSTSPSPQAPGSNGRSYDGSKANMKSLTSNSQATKTIKVSIHLSQQLYDRNGHVPDSELAKYLAKALDEAGYNYEIVYNFAPKPTPDETTQCKAAFKWWGAQVTQGRLHKQFAAVVPGNEFRKDSNILLVDRNSGGCAYIGGKIAIKGGRGINEVRQWQETGHNSDDYIRLLHGSLHEIGHNLGISHKDAGMTWNKDGEFHRSPMGYAGRTNQCGEENELKQGDFNGKIVHTIYSDCAAKNFVIN